jgi:hypothetical protein
VYGPQCLRDLPEGQRSIFWSVAPICTYAYAVSSAGAAKLLDFADQWQAEAYDIKVRDACQSKVLKCISVVDQLFHHYRPSLKFGQESEIMRIEKHANSSTAALEDEPGSTAVILRSARCKALFGMTCLDTSTMDERPYKDQ